MNASGVPWEVLLPCLALAGAGVGAYAAVRAELARVGERASLALETARAAQAEARAALLAALGKAPA